MALGRKPRIKIPKGDINHAALREHSKTYRLSAAMIYHLVNKGDLTPTLITENDHRVLKLMGGLSRDNMYARLMMRPFTPKQRAFITETVDYTEKESTIYRNMLKYEAEGKKLPTTISICAEVYVREGKIYTSTNPDFALINTIKKIRKRVENQRYRAGKNGCPFSQDEMEGPVEVPE